MTSMTTRVGVLMTPRQREVLISYAQRRLKTPDVLIALTGLPQDTARARIRYGCNLSGFKKVVGRLVALGLLTDASGLDFLDGYPPTDLGLVVAQAVMPRTRT